MFNIRNIEVFENEGERGEQSQSQQLVIYDEEQAEKIDPDGSHINNIVNTLKEEDGVLLIEGEKEDDCQHLYLPPPGSSSGGNEKDGTSFDEMDVVDASTHHHHHHSGKKKKSTYSKKKRRKSSKHQRYAQ